MTARVISLKGVAVNNLRDIDLDIPHRQLVVLCGLSGSGKSSLAFDTLYAEGQRRYIETFSAYARQFLEQLEKPEAERIDGIPPAIAVARQSPSRSSRSTVGTTTETIEFLRLLYAKIAHVICPKCDREVLRESAQSAADNLSALPAGKRFMITYAAWPGDEGAYRQLAASLREDGFLRVVFENQTRNLGADTLDPPEDARGPLYVVVDRLRTGDLEEKRLRESLEQAFAQGDGACHVFMENAESVEEGKELSIEGRPFEIDGAPWLHRRWSSHMVCDGCGREFTPPEPRLYSFNSALGACPECEGFGNIIDLDMDLVVPDRSKTIREGAIAPWNTPAYAHELEELLALADDYQVPVDVPFHELTDEQIQLLHDGVPEREFGGLSGFFDWLERRKYKMHIRVFLSRWRSSRECETCHGTRLRDEALCGRIAGLNIAEISELKIRDAAKFFKELELPAWEQAVGAMMLEQVRSRLAFLQAVGLGYLTLDRMTRTLSGGEVQRVALTTALGSSLVNMLYVLDEPSVGLHPRDSRQLLDVILQLRDRGNSVVVVEHDEAIIRQADQVIEIGPGAGERGGRVIFQGTPDDIEDETASITGDYLSGRRGGNIPAKRRQPNHGWIRLAGARGNNLQNITVEFPLGVLCVVTGVSGSGKSTLVQDTLYPALCRRMRKEAPKPYDFDDVLGDGQIEDAVLVDQSPIGRSARSNPVTYLKAFDEIRAAFAETMDARMRNFSASHFSFNVDGGRCSACQGDGQVRIDMQFLPDVYMKCSQCHGTRYRPEVLEVTYRGRNIADVLEMTVREAFNFFRGSTKVQAKLKRLIDVGLDYVRLGQPANTLSGGEAQRLKLAGYISSKRRGRCLFLLDEPSTGLHFADVAQLLDCFDALLAVGHSLIVVEHNMQLIQAADYVIDIGPGAADEGGQVVATGSPEAISNQPQSVTGQFLSEAFSKNSIREQSA